MLGVSGFFMTGDRDILLGDTESFFHARDTKRWKLLDGVCIYHYDLFLNPLCVVRGLFSRTLHA